MLDLVLLFKAEVICMLCCCVFRFVKLLLTSTADVTYLKNDKT